MKTESGSEHTPTPWGRAGAQLIGNEAREIIGLLKNTDAGTDAQANAAFIVQAVNAHAELLDALTELVRQIETHSASFNRIPANAVYMNEARIAIARAEGGK